MKKIYSLKPANNPIILAESNPALLRKQSFWARVWVWLGIANSVEVEI